MKKINKNNKIPVIIGPTSSGKTALAVKLALRLGGEIVSADSRQVYKYMDIGTGKDLPEYKVRMRNQESGIRNDFNFKKSKIKGEFYINIPYHLIDIIHPNTSFDLAKFVKKATRAIEDVQKRGRLPIVCGGTGLYAQALVDAYNLSARGENKELRQKLEEKTLKQIQAQLKKVDLKKYQTLNNSEFNNKRRLIRLIEQAKSKNCQSLEIKNAYKKEDFIVLGITHPREVIKEKIYARLLDRMGREDMLSEVKRLHKKHRVSWKRMENFGLEYRYTSRYLRGKITYDEMIEQLNIAIRQFAKRQMSWYKRWEAQGQKIHWVKNQTEALEVIKKK